MNGPVGMGKMFLPPFLVLFALCASAHGAETVEGATNTIASKPTTIAVVGDYPPYDVYKDGQASGIADDMMIEVFRRLNMPVTIQKLPFKRALEYLKKGDIDGLSGVGKSREREQYVVYPKSPLTTTTVGFFVRHDSNIVYRGDLREMGQYTIGTVLGFLYTQEFKTLVDRGVLHTEASNTVESNIQKLAGKRYDMFIANSEVTLHVAKQLGVLSQLRELSPPVDTGYMYLGISKKSPLASSIDKISEALIAIREDGTEQKIRARYTK